MNNCLKTQLKAAVNNNNLPKLGELIFKVNVPSNATTANSKIVVVNGKSCKVYVPAGKNLYDSSGNSLGSEVTIAANTLQTICLLDTGEYNVYVTEKYSLKNLSLNNYSNMNKFSFDINELKYSGNLDTFGSVENSYGDISSLSASKSTLTAFRVSNYTIKTEGITFTLAQIAEFTKLKYVAISQNKNAYGDIAVLSALSELLNIELGNTNISGSIDDIANAQKSSRSNGSTIVIKGNGIITYKSNGDGTGTDTVIANGTNKTITFNGQGGYSIS